MATPAIGLHFELIAGIGKDLTDKGVGSYYLSSSMEVSQPNHKDNPVQWKVFTDTEI